ncbi:hypothetical protein FV438_12635 [Escherichia coli]|nr:hypothetical protein FV438_12635 [Escherichia coli]
MSIKNDGHYFCRAGGNRPDGLNEPVTVVIKGGAKLRHIMSHKGLQGLTCIEMLIKCRLVILI